MTLKETINNQLIFAGRTPGGCCLVLKNLLDCGRDIHQFMQLFTAPDIEAFYQLHQDEIDDLCSEDEELMTDASVYGYTKLALEKTLMLIEAEMKNGGNDYG